MGRGISRRNDAPKVFNSLRVVPGNTRIEAHNDKSSALHQQGQVFIETLKYSDFLAELVEEEGWRVYRGQWEVLWSGDALFDRDDGACLS